MQKMQLGIDILKEAIDVLKKDSGINMAHLSNGEKVVIVDALKRNYSLHVLLSKLKMAESSYYYQKQRTSFKSKNEAAYRSIAAIFQENTQRYGYRRIKAILTKQGYILLEKVIQKITREHGLFVKCRKVKEYCSYKGKISPEVPNVIQRNFNSKPISPTRNS